MCEAIYVDLNYFSYKYVLLMCFANSWFKLFQLYCVVLLLVFVNKNLLLDKNLKISYVKT